MKTILVISMILVLAGCTSTGSVVKIGRDSYMVDVSHSTVGSGTAGYAGLRSEAIKTANTYCASLNQVMKLDGWTSEGTPGFSSTNVNVRFFCLQQNDPHNNMVSFEAAPDKIIEVRNR